jgi:hypothetical protein
MNITAQECRVQAKQCEAMGRREGISVRRGTILIAIGRTSTTMANQKDRYTEIKKQEAKKVA